MVEKIHPPEWEEKVASKNKSVNKIKDQITIN